MGEVSASLMINNVGMALGWKLVMDCSDAPAQAEFWGAALGYEVEDPGLQLLSHALHSGTDPERLRRRFELLAKLAHAVPVLRLSASPDTSASVLAGLIHAELAHTRTP